MAYGEDAAQALMAAAQQLRDASGMASGVGDAVEQATGMARQAFESSGGPLMDALGRLDQLGINCSDIIIECQSIAQVMDDAAGQLRSM